MPILNLTCRTLDGAESEPSTTLHRRSRHFSKSALSKFRTGNLRTQIYPRTSDYLVNNTDMYCNVHFNHLKKFRRRRSRNIFFSLNIRLSTIISRNNTFIFFCKTNYYPRSLIPVSDFSVWEAGCRLKSLKWQKCINNMSMHCMLWRCELRKYEQIENWRCC